MTKSNTADQSMSSKQHPLFVCVQSRKGGVGKTTIALALGNLLREKYQYEVILVDLDITGTAINEGIEHSDWKKDFHIIQKPEDQGPANPIHRPEDQGPANLIEMFQHYMAGRCLPPIAWHAEMPTGTRKQLSLVLGRVNLLPSFLKTAGIHCAGAHAPNVLFDEMHSLWFIEMLQDLLAQAAESNLKYGRARPLAVIFDNSPGFSGIQPILEEWLTDVGPLKSKFLFVASVDSQDLAGNIDSVARVDKAVQQKLAGASAFAICYRDPDKFGVEKNSPAAQFFNRLAEAVPDKAPCIEWIKAEGSIPFPRDKCLQRCSLDCNFSYYLEASRERGASAGRKTFLGMVLNKVPVISGVSVEEVVDQATSGMELLKEVGSFAMPFDQTIAAGFLLNTLEKLSVASASKITANAAGKSSQELLHTVAGLLSVTGVSPETIVVAAFRWHAELYRNVHELAKTESALDVIWFDELSPIVSLIGLIPARLSRAKAAKLAAFSDNAIKEGFSKDIRLVQEALKRVHKVESKLRSTTEKWLDKLNSKERGVAAMAWPFLLAAGAVNGALSGTPIVDTPQAAPDLARLAALSQIKFSHLPPSERECAEWLQSKARARANSRTDREQSLLALAREVAGKDRIKPTATFDEFREGFCTWVLRLRGFPATIRLFSECRRVGAVLGSSELVRNAVIREVLRQVIVSGQLAPSRGVQLIQQAFSASNTEELLKSWDKFAALTRLSAGIANLLEDWRVRK